MQKIVPAGPSEIYAKSLESLVIRHSSRWAMANAPCRYLMAGRPTIPTLPNSAYRRRLFPREPTSKITRVRQNVLGIRIQWASGRGGLEKDKRVDGGVRCGSVRIGSSGGMLNSKACTDGNGYISNIDPRASVDEHALFKEMDIPSKPSKEKSAHSISGTRIGEDIQVDKLKVLKLKLESKGIHFDSFTPGQYVNILCPKCGGGQQKCRSFSLFIRKDLELAMWLCFRHQCGWRGHVQASSLDGSRSASGTKNTRLKRYKLSTKVPVKVGAHFAMRDKTINTKGYRVITEESLRLEPLCEEFIRYFSERMISLKTLQRNGVMQRKYKDQKIFIAFPYRRNGMLISCKYRSIDKEFLQERGTDSIFYGMDDITQASDIIIVEGEMDKLSMEEAGYQNCISVPNGAPQKFSRKESTNGEQDSKHRYLYNCKEYLTVAPRIILASDADPPGQALAEELAQHLGAERCWRVRWPKRNNSDVCKDANEVLVYLGPDALREVVENAEPWHYISDVEYDKASKNLSLM